MWKTRAQLPAVQDAGEQIDWLMDSVSSETYLQMVINNYLKKSASA